MNIQDPIADLLTQIRNGYLSRKDHVTVYSSKIKILILNVLKKEYFITDFVLIDNNKPQIKIILKYYGKKIPIMKKITRISKPSLRIYSKYKLLPSVANGFGIYILSTSHGIMSDKEAKLKKYGGEIICSVE